MRTSSLASLIQELVVSIDSTARQIAVAGVEPSRRAPLPDRAAARVVDKVPARFSPARPGARQRATEAA